MAYRDSGHRTCPSCEDAALSPSLLGVWASEVCKSCKGVWYKESALTAMLKEVTVSSTPASLFDDARSHSGERQCPECVQSMSVFRLEEGEMLVELDRCDVHGVWFDERKLDTTMKILSERDDRELPAHARSKPSLWGSIVGFVLDLAADAKLIKPRRR